MTNPANFTSSVSEDSNPGFDDLDIKKEDTFDTSGVREFSPLEALQDAVQEVVALDIVEARIPKRPKLMLMIDPNLVDGDKIQIWNRACTKYRGRGPNARQETDGIKMAALVVANCTIGVKVQHPDTGEFVEAREESGGPITFQTPYFRKMLLRGREVSSGIALVKELFVSDGHLVDAGTRVMEAAGFGDDELDDENPTMM